MTRDRIDLPSECAFREGKAKSFLASGGTWEAVSLPHCWNGEDTFQRGREYRRGFGSYRLSVDLPKAGDSSRSKEWVLRTGGFYGLVWVRINGKSLGRFTGQYLGLQIDVSDVLRWGETNEVVLELSNRCPSWVLPGHDKPDFLLFGGLATKVWLEATGPLSLREDVQILTRSAVGTSQCEIRWSLSGTPSSDAVIDWQLRRDGEGEILKQSSFPADADQCHWEVPDAELWSPESPALYEARGTLSIAGRVADQLAFRFGFREMDFNEEGFFLNGERLELRGFNRHECLPGMGNALPDWLHREDAETMRNHGANFVRLAHYPHQPEFLDACDELGLIVFAELASWKSVRGGRWLRSAREQLKRLILRDRNRPCVATWGLGNESRHRGAYLELDALAREVDPTRPTTYAENHLYRAQRARTLGLVDVWSCNYEVEALDEVRHHGRSGAVIVSEACNEQAERGDREAESVQLASVESLWETLEAKSFVAGHTLWAFNDYPTEFRERFVRLNGKFDAWRTPKRAAHLFRARYSEKPFVMLAAPWGGDAAQVEVDLFTNAQRTQLFVGGALLESFEGRGHHRTTLPFSPLPLTAVGDFRGQRAESVILPYGEARSLCLRERKPASELDWRDLSLEVLDEAGARVRNWSGWVRLTVSEGAKLYALDEKGSVRIREGLGRAFLRLDRGEDVRLAGQAIGLDPIETLIEADLNL